MRFKFKLKRTGEKPPESKPRMGIFAMVAKFLPKTLSIALKVFKTKLGLAALSYVSYSFLFTWQFAVIVMTMLFIHENGHVWAMRRIGMKTRGFYFLPFIGGAAMPDEPFPTWGAESFIALMGPIWGLGLATVALFTYFIAQNAYAAAAASWLAFITVFNLFPISPLDGGRVMRSVAFSVNRKLGIGFLIAGLVAALVLFLVLKIFILLFVFVLGALELWSERKRRVEIEGMSPRMIAASIIVYCAIIAFHYGSCFSLVTCKEQMAACKYYKTETSILKKEERRGGFRWKVIMNRRPRRELRQSRDH